MPEEKMIVDEPQLPEDEPTIIIPAAIRYFEMIRGGITYPPIPFDPEKRTLSIGRESGNGIQVLVLTPDGRTVSRNHAELKYNAIGNECLLGDKESKHGTYVRGERLKPGEYQVLRDRDEIRFGKVEVVFREDLRGNLN
jgi:pSer/pThr/pTyr-binding forkhead associated (FHA) protein